jgi:LemA protein
MAPRWVALKVVCIALSGINARSAQSHHALTEPSGSKHETSPSGPDEQDTVTKVIEARSRATAIQATPELVNDPQAFRRFQQVQGELGGALSRLMVVAENYPGLKANQAFRDLQAQLEGTENRITVARNRYIKAVQDYNVTVRSFPSNLTAMAFGFKEKANFAVENEREIDRPPAVRFDKPVPASASDPSPAASR